MIRKDREVTDFNEIVEMLKNFKHIQLGMSKDNMPYVVPMNFGFEVIDGKVVIYIHSAGRGMKIDILKENPNVCVQGNTFIKVTASADRSDCTSRYESVTGFGKAEPIESIEEKQHAAGCLVQQLRIPKEMYDHMLCKAYKGTNFYKIVLNEITGKKNPVPEGM